jgi:hypothetical protein
MAYQHFYSRVPARVSMYHKADGFDTFAHSEGLERDFIENELSVVYQNKLAKGDVESVRRGEHPSVYLQYPFRNGRLVQSCTTYLPLDYTGERSAYLTHSLVMEEQEVVELFFNKDALMLNPEMFVKDISEFNITSSNTTPNRDYPTLEYKALTLKKDNFTEKYSPETIKSFIYAMILALKGKGKNIFFRLPTKEELISEEAVAFINRITSVLPYRFREILSFVTYITDYSQYPNFKIKCVSEKCGEFQSSRGVFIDFEANLVVGVTEDDLLENKTLLNFFYYLLDNESVREKFIEYMEHAITVIPTLQASNVKILNDLVFLFCATCGRFSENSILPNDNTLYDLFCVYDKYRAILEPEYRDNLYRTLARYPATHTAIPKNIFTKLSKLYPMESENAKKVAMTAVLELIHTDIMREKLFGFIKANYNEESSESKALINEDLARVFYGGFLQSQLIEFFSSNFASEPIETKDIIVERFYLAIRTASISGKIIEFIDTHYDSFTKKQKDAFYDTFFEMIPEVDDLAVSLVKLVNKHIENESEEVISDFISRLTELLDKDRYCKIMGLLVSCEGYCKHETQKLIFTEWSTRKIYAEYINTLARASFANKSKDVIFVLSNYLSEGSNQAKKLVEQIEFVYAADIAKVALGEWLDLDDSFALLGDTIYSELKEKLIYKAVKASIGDVFKVCYGRELMTRAYEYCKKNPAICDCDGYSALHKYYLAVDAIEQKNASEAFAALCAIDEDSPFRTDMAEYIRTFIYRKQSQDFEKNMLAELAVNSFGKGMAVNEIYSSYMKIYTQQYLMQHGAKANEEKASHDGAISAMSKLWSYLVAISTAGESACKLLAKDTTAFDEALWAFSGDIGRAANKWIATNMGERPTALVEAFAKFESRIKISNGGFFAKLFGKK